MKPTRAEANAEVLREHYRQLLEENERLKAELREKKTIINRAKDISPVVRPRANRVFKLDVGMALSRVTGGWILECGELRRKFKRLSTTWELVTTNGLEIKHIFINEPIKKRAVVSLPAPTISPLVIDKDSSTDEKIKLIEKCAIAVPTSIAQSLKDFSLEQVSAALGYYKATIAKGKEIKSATGWLLKCLKEEWYKNFVPEAPAYSPKIFTVANLPDVEVVPMPKNWREMVLAALPGETRDSASALAKLRVQQRLDNLVPY
ncbi:hypothetical protein [Chlorogloea sp. CCALA 695]|uniref:hypothetical protein n=1 Tax=Chlorogloea sp. CCALA 695 TaxID=2107693 RepID=UPI000D05B284|nr:hypothetical protein [Chlorogloea sp. CCALA 695]PSB33771.1 hypothetical protein C7B70_05570 [Chlorogloea sp. CCALA 695]